MSNKIMYVLVRTDLPVSSSAVQAGHAVARYALIYPHNFKAWNNNTLIYLGVKSLFALNIWIRKLKNRGVVVPIASFHESDINDEATAIACVVDDDLRYVFKNLKLLQ